MKHTKLLKVVATSLAVVTASCGSAYAAAITGSSANINIISAPASVQTGNLEQDGFFNVFEEQTTVVTNLGVNASTVGDSFPPAPVATTISGSVTSFFLHYDSDLDPATLTGFLEFDGPILGIIWGAGLLDSSDSILGAVGTTYSPAGSARGYESGNDSVVFTSLNRVDFESLANNGIDSLRVLVAADIEVSEPSILAVFGLGLLGLGFARRKQPV